jgi:glutaredoxin 3
MPSENRVRPGVRPVVKIYTRSGCGYCTAAIALIERLGLTYEETSLDGRPDLRRKISSENGNWPTVPMIFVDGEFVGGFDDFAELNEKGRFRKPA